MIRKLLVLLLAVLPFAACQNRPDPSPEPSPRMEVVALEFVDSTEMADTLQQFAAQDGGGLKVVGDARTNSVIVSGSSTQLDQVKAMIARLDVESK